MELDFIICKLIIKRRHRIKEKNYTVVFLMTNEKK